MAPTPKMQRLIDMGMVPGAVAVHVDHRGKRHTVTVDSYPEYDWVHVVGIRGRTGAITVPTSTVRGLRT